MSLLDPFGQPIAACGLLAFFSCTAYCVLRHKLLDIDMVVSRGVAYSLLVPLLAVTWWLSGELCEQLTAQVVHANSVWGSLASSLAVALIFGPAYRIIQRRVDSFFMRDADMVLRLRRLAGVWHMAIGEDVEGLESLQADLGHVIEHVRRTRSQGGRP